MFMLVNSFIAETWKINEIGKSKYSQEGRGKFSHPNKSQAKFKSYPPPKKRTLFSENLFGIF